MRTHNAKCAFLPYLIDFRQSNMAKKQNLRSTFGIMSTHVRQLTYTCQMRLLSIRISVAHISSQALTIIALSVRTAHVCLHTTVWDRNHCKPGFGFP